jgi:hypothetical protein
LEGLGRRIGFEPLLSIFLVSLCPYRSVHGTTQNGDKHTNGVSFGRCQRHLPGLLGTVNSFFTPSTDIGKRLHVFFGGIGMVAGLFCLFYGSFLRLAGTKWARTLAFRAVLPVVMLLKSWDE